MQPLDADARAATIMLSFEVDPSDQRALVELARATQPIFARQRGFVSASLLRSADGMRVLHILRWRTRADGEACMRSADWASEAGARFMAFLGAGRATMESRSYEAIASVAAAE